MKKTVGNKARIIDAIEVTLDDVMFHVPSYRRCYARAVLTHAVLSQVVPDAWQIQAGSLEAIADAKGDYAVGWDFDAGQAEGRGFDEIHLWVARRHGKGSDVEIVDATTRHLPAMAPITGVAWTRRVLSYAWDTSSALTAMGYRYRASTVATAHALTYGVTSVSHVDELTFLATQRIRGAVVTTICL